MNEEMQLRYLYFLTHMNSGGERWTQCYEAWEQFGRDTDSEEYSELIDKVRAFHKKYSNINKKARRLK